MAQTAINHDHGQENMGMSYDERPYQSLWRAALLRAVQDMTLRPSWRIHPYALSAIEWVFADRPMHNGEIGGDATLELTGWSASTLRRELLERIKEGESIEKIALRNIRANLAMYVSGGHLLAADIRKEVERLIPQWSEQEMAA